MTEKRGGLDDASIDRLVRARWSENRRSLYWARRFLERVAFDAIATDTEVVEAVEVLAAGDPVWMASERRLRVVLPLSRLSHQDLSQLIGAITADDEGLTRLIRGRLWHASVSLATPQLDRLQKASNELLLVPPNLRTTLYYNALVECLGQTDPNKLVSMRAEILQGDDEFDRPSHALRILDAALAVGALDVFDETRRLVDSVDDSEIQIVAMNYDGRRALLSGEISEAVRLLSQIALADHVSWNGDMLQLAAEFVKRGHDLDAVEKFLTAPGPASVGHSKVLLQQLQARRQHH